jgi:predicted amidophosphoribosyltransferase
MGQLLHFAKQGQNKKLSLRLIQLSIPKIHQLIELLEVDAVGFIPPTIRRDVQFMTLLEKNLQIHIPKIKILKVKGEITVPQKALSKIEDRVLNAQKSLIPIETRNFQKVLLIDDAVGSGATLNETARKMIKKDIGKEIYGLAITGSFKGFEVITEA